MDSDRILDIWLKLQEDQIIDGKFSEDAFFVRGRFHFLLDTQKLLAKKVLDNCPFIEPLLEVFDSTGIIHREAKVTRGVIVQYLEGCFVQS
jgi:hypothetical protein